MKNFYYDYLVHFADDYEVGFHQFNKGGNYKIYDSNFDDNDFNYFLEVETLEQAKNFVEKLVKEYQDKNKDLKIKFRFEWSKKEWLNYFKSSLLLNNF